MYGDIHLCRLTKLHIHIYIYIYAVQETKFIMCKPLVLREAAVSMHYKYMESSRSY